jgi:hypothetical protein
MVSLPWVDQWERQEELAAVLLDFARSQPHAPVLFPETTQRCSSARITASGSPRARG